MEIMEEVKRFVDAQCAIALELKTLNGLVRQHLLGSEGPRTAVAPTVLPDPDEADAEKKTLRARLTELGVQVPPRIRIERLRELVVEAERNAATATAAPAPAADADDVFAQEAAPVAAKYTIDQVRAVVVDAIDKFSQKESGEPQDARNKGAAKVKAIVLKHMGTSIAKEWPVEKYGVLVMALNAAVEAL